MGNRQKRRAKLQDRITERKAEAIAFPSKYAQKTQPVAKPRPRMLSRPALTALAIVCGMLLVAAGGSYMILSSGAHSPASIVHQLGVARH